MHKQQRPIGKSQPDLIKRGLIGVAKKWFKKIPFSKFEFSNVLIWSVILLIIFIAVTPPIRARILSILNLDGSGTSGVREEIIEKRTRYAKVFRNPNGTHTTLIFITPAHYLDEKGNWQDLEGQIVDSQGAGAGFIAQFGKTPGLEFDTGSTKIALTPQNANQIQGKTEKNQVIYIDAFDATDIKLSVGTTQLEQQIILKDKAAPSSFSYKIASNIPVPQPEDSEIVFSDCKIVRPYAHDAKGHTYPVEVELASLSDGSYLILSLGNELLEVASYPIVIDANIAIQSGSVLGQDAYVDKNQADTNFNNTIELGAYDNLATRTRSYLQFDLKSVPDGSIISSASLQLYSQDALGSSIYLRKVTSSWDEETINWNNQPLFQEVISSKVVDAPGAWATWDTTKLVKDWCAGKMPNYGMALMAGETATSSGGLFCSSDFSADNTLRPKLVIDFIPDIESPGSVINEPKDNVYLKGAEFIVQGTANDNPGGSGLAKVEVSVDGGATWIDAKGTDNWTYKRSSATDGIYKIESRATDIADNSETPSTSANITVDNIPPNSLIESPTGGSVKGMMIVSGAASDENFKSFKLEYGEGTAPTEWTKFGAVRLEPVLRGKLGDGFTYSLNNGFYTIRLVVEDKAGNISTDSVVVKVSN